MLQRAGPVLSCLDIQTRLVTVTGFCHSLKTFYFKSQFSFPLFINSNLYLPFCQRRLQIKKEAYLPTLLQWLGWVWGWDRGLCWGPGVSVRVGLGLGLEFDFLFFSPRKNWQCILRLLSRFSDVVRFCSLSLLFRTIIEQSSMCVLGCSGTFLFLIIFLNFWRWNIDIEILLSFLLWD